MDFLTEQALPLAMARFSRCANVATNVASGKRIRVACNVAWYVAANVAAEEHSRIAFGGAINVVQVKRIRALNVAPSVASLLHRLFSNSLTPLLP
jgi:ribosomal 50S subunit-recycling heat shock protein